VSTLEQGAMGTNDKGVTQAADDRIGPAGSLWAMKITGANGGGFYGMSSAHPFDNPNAVTNFLTTFCMMLFLDGIVTRHNRWLCSIKWGKQRGKWQNDVPELTLTAKRTLRVILEACNAIGHFEPRLSSRAPHAEARLDFGFVVEGSAHYRANIRIAVECDGHRRSASLTEVTP
jgi:hypothetical protein